MIKRIFSKKSGFTLVEIVVSFAVFAIMAAAIMQILNLVAYERSENAEFLASLERQEKMLAANEKQEFKKKVGEVVLNFNDKKTNIDYDMKAANGAEDGIGEGLTYFVSQKSQDSNESLTQPGGSGGEKGGDQGQLSNIDARITGSTKFDYIKVMEVKKATDYSGEGVCYYLKVSAQGLTMSKQESMYAQFKLNFFSTETANETDTYTDASNKTYNRITYLPADIVDAGYINSDDFSWGTHVSVVKDRHSSSGDSTENPLQVTKTGSNTIRIGAPYSTTTNNGFDFSTVQTAKIYVVFKDDPNLTVSSFGNNGVSVSDGVIFKHFPIYNEVYDANGKFQYTSKTGKTSNYIYGAKMYDRKYQ